MSAHATCATIAQVLDSCCPRKISHDNSLTADSTNAAAVIFCSSYSCRLLFLAATPPQLLAEYEPPAGGERQPKRLHQQVCYCIQLHPEQNSHDKKRVRRHTGVTCSVMGVLASTFRRSSSISSSIGFTLAASASSSSCTDDRENAVSRP